MMIVNYFYHLRLHTTSCHTEAMLVTGGRADEAYGRQAHWTIQPG
jgi:hypothetical protein